MVLETERDLLAARIETRFRQMVRIGALDEVRANLPHWSPDFLSSKAIGAPELISHLKGEITLEAAINAAVISTRQFAKRQRTWFRARMKDWHHIQAPGGAEGGHG